MTTDPIDKIVEISKSVVFLIFISNKCKYCDGIAKKMNDILKRKKIEMIKINVDDDYTIMEKYSIKQTPTVLIYYNNHIVDCIVGDQDVDRYLLRIQ